MVFPEKQKNRPEFAFLRGEHLKRGAKIDIITIISTFTRGGNDMVKLIRQGVYLMEGRLVKE